MKAAGERALLYYDSTNRVLEGDYIRTQTGRTYLVDVVRIQQAGKHAGRQHLVCTVMPDGHDPEPDARVLPIAWYPRKRSHR